MTFRAIAIGAGLLAGASASLSAGPPSETWFSSCEGPIATCDRPHPSSVIEEMRSEGVYQDGASWRADPQLLRLPGVCPADACDSSAPVSAARPDRRRDGPRPVPESGIREARAMLRQWEAASRSRLPASEAEELWLAHARPDLSGRERAIFMELQGPIDVGMLWERYEWNLVGEGRTWVLVAIPRDSLDRLLCGRVEIRLDENWRVASMVFADASGRNRAMIAQRETVHTAAKIVPIGYISEFSEPALLRTAAIEDAVELSPQGTESGPRLLRVDEPLLLPGAPVDEIVPVDVD